MASSSNGGSAAAGGGTSILTVLQVIFIVLKLTGIGNFANWSWWKVFIPTWIGIGIFLLVILIAFIWAIIKVAKSRR